MIYNDLDEYFHIEKNTIINVINQTKDVDTFMFLNIWADTIDIPTDINKYFKDLEMNTDLPTTFYIDKTIGLSGIRSKCIHKTSSTYYIQNVHSGQYYNDTKNIVTCDISGIKLIMFHFFRWSPTNKETALIQGRDAASTTRQRTNPDISFNNYQIFRIK